jgi:hypothetical protein
MTYEKWKLALIAIVTIAVLIVLGVQLSCVNPFVSSWDQVDFSLAIERYDLRAMQPHFPGYPYFILGGMLTNPFIGEPNQALVLFNILIYASSIIPVYFLAARMVSKLSAIMIAAILYTMSYPILIVNQPMSEGAALAVFWWFFWSVIAAGERLAGRWMLLPMFLFSVLMGIRLSYIPMGIGIIYMLYKKWNNSDCNIAGIIQYIIAAGVFQLFWIGALILSEGGLGNFLELAFGFTGGHFQEWGGSAVSNELSLFSRIRLFLFTNIFWWGIFSRTSVLMVLYIVMGILMFLPKTKCSPFKNPAFLLGTLLMASYGIWAYFAQNIDKPRHILPAALLLVFLGMTFLLQKRESKPIVWLSAIVVAVQSLISVNLIMAQASEQPAVYQLASFLADQQEEFVLYTWEETRVLEYMNMPYPHKRVFTYEVFLHDQGYYSGKSVYLTDSVVEGFRLQGTDIEEKIEKVKVFKSDQIFDPVYHEIILYKWTP